MASSDMRSQRCGPCHVSEEEDSPPSEGFDLVDAADESEEAFFDFLEPPPEPPLPSDVAAPDLEASVLDVPPFDAPPPESPLAPLVTLSGAASLSEAASLSDEAAFLYSSLR